MASELPYFRFTVQDWQNGKISLENYELQGLFISICGYYWINDCSITLAMLEKKFRDAKDLLKQLIDLGILKHENRHDKIEIEFLNLQYDLLSEKRKRRQVAGSMGGNAKAMLKQKCSYKDNNKDNNKDNILLPLKEANEAVTVNDNVTDIINYLNLKAGKNFKSTSEKTKTMISARLKEGYKIEDFKKVIDIKSDKWKNDPKMCDYLRPETLFGTKFESYLNEIPKAEIKSNDEEKFFRSFENGKIIDTRNFKPGTLFTKSGEPILV